MPHLLRGPGALRRNVGLVSAGVVVAGLLASVPVANAAGDISGSKSLAGSSSTAQRFTPGRYIVLLRAPGAVSHSVSASRAGGTQFRPGSPAVRAYTAQLRASHDSIAREFGTRALRDYTAAVNGFTADLTTAQALDLATDRRTLLVEKQQVLKPDTWNTPTFLGLDGPKGSWTTHGGQMKAGDGIVVADLDTGIWPESRSFKGKKLAHKQKTKWDISQRGSVTRMEKADGGVFTGECVAADGWSTSDCSTKIISARTYSDYPNALGLDQLSPYEHISPRDGGGHGTHTASTAAGNWTTHAVTEGVDFGTVSGMAPAAKIAVYKVCWEAIDPDDSGCGTSDMIAAIDQAVIDGADVLNFSIGGGASPVLDSLELAFEGAAEAGIFVAASAGNSGPDPSTLDHPSPWLTTVAASTHYNFDNTIVLGNGKKIVGQSVAKTAVPSSPVVTAEASVVDGGDPDDAAICGPDTLDPAAVTGKIVVCLRGTYDRVAKSAEVKRAGGKAMILVNPSPNSLDADFHAVPTIHISDTDGVKLFAYLDSAGAAAKASFALGNLTNTTTPLPQVTGFSSRGPVLVSGGDLLKPDISAPGASVLAAVSPPSNSGRKYDLYSGTSMAAPHITGLAAFIQGRHPSWTPMEIKSAMMTTAKPTKTETGGSSKDAFAQGSGQVTPKDFFDPGLFVTSSATQWRGYLTSEGFNTGVPAVEAKQVNLPSMADGSVTGLTSFKRSFRATQAGTWKIAFKVPGFAGTASHKIVKADHVNDVQDVKFTFTRTTAPLGTYAKGWVVLTGPTKVKLPVALLPLAVAAPAKVSGEGVAGSIEVPITSGFTGDLDVTTTGFAQSIPVAGSVAEGDYTLECVTVTADTSLARFDVDSIDNTADLDMYVYQADTCDPATAYAIAGESATGAADESVTVTDPDAGVYIVEIDGFTAGNDGDPMDYAFDFYDVDPAATLGALSVTPNPVPVTLNQAASFDVSWTGLAPAANYLGFLGYAGSDVTTEVQVSTIVN